MRRHDMNGVGLQTCRTDFWRQTHAFTGDRRTGTDRDRPDPPLSGRRRLHYPYGKFIKQVKRDEHKHE